MEISLVRHGKSQWTENKAITCQEFRNWVEKYDSHGVFEETSYPPETLEKITKAKMLITSHLTRSIESAKLLNPTIQTISDPLFRETELPNPLVTLRGLRLYASVWAVLLRCLWFIGYSRECESLREAQKRAKQASIQLVTYAKEYHHVVLVGHGFFNMLIAKELKKMGWSGAGKSSSKHWNCTTYSI
ncbi:histidine phosphatase family protein [Lederbergia wuyishanensis]|uniref:Broad specificity phosphatase PhoE n=1 Tax=Lederbergia wuyishanensis TaxID=1347903 RepID=A0ABU0D287_9BACI|nr:phosphoglycerate mutase family protein [Lederbergia wuyishanensis]MCJ8007341.1 histidine phosphatase family protein [Lederbergia wuyishanensis]MDQ0342493.1 broad specificity phosphatase PhoE [Lederbergia wuyishanensis]